MPTKKKHQKGSKSINKSKSTKNISETLNLDKPQPSIRERAINLLKILEGKLSSNASTIHLVGYIIPESIIAWNCTFPEIFPKGHRIMGQYEHIGPPRDNLSKSEAINWLSNALALSTYAIDYLNGLIDNEFKSAGLHIYGSSSPPVQIKGYLEQYDDNKDKKLYKFLIKIAEEGELCSSIGCKLACSFCIRKILEESIKKKIMIDFGPSSIDYLKAMINRLQPKLGYKLHKDILSRKLLIEESIHADHNPTNIELNTATALIFRVIEKLELFDKKNGRV